MNFKGKDISKTGVFQSYKYTMASAIILLLIGLIALAVVFPIISDILEDATRFRGEVSFDMDYDEFLAMIGATIFVTALLILLGVVKLATACLSKDMKGSSVIREVAVSPNADKSLSYIAVFEDDICPACDQRINPGHKYCSECGVQLIEDSVYKAASLPAEDQTGTPAAYCTGCGTRLDADDLFCSKCGKPKKE